jgi:hypothetical protein
MADSDKKNECSMAKRRKGRGGSQDSLAHTSTRYNLEREPLQSDRSIPSMPMPTDRTGWDWVRRRRMAGSLGVLFIILILLIGALTLVYFDDLWNIMIQRWQ